VAKDDAEGTEKVPIEIADVLSHLHLKRSSQKRNPQYFQINSLIAEPSDTRFERPLEKSTNAKGYNAAKRKTVGILIAKSAPYCLGCEKI
jgi:hypothetical protein